MARILLALLKTWLARWKQSVAQRAIVAVTIGSKFQGFRITGYKGTASGATFDELLQHAESMGANAIIGACYDNALDVETLFHGAAVVIEPIQPHACELESLGGPQRVNL